METTVDKSQVRVWIYRSLKKLSPEMESEITSLAGKFVSQWAAHGKKLAADFDIHYGHYLVFFVDQQMAEASGCSIDTQVHFIRQIEAKYQLGLLDRMQIGFLNEGEIDFHHFNDLADLRARGVIRDNDIVINPMVQNLEEFESSFALPFKDSPFS